MPRPQKCRLVDNFPQITVFKPVSDSLSDLKTVILKFEELEALRLADYEGKKHEEAAYLMNVSRATFGRILEKARYIVTGALLNGKAIIISGGEFCCRNIPQELDELFKAKLKKCIKCDKYTS